MCVRWTTKDNRTMHPFKALSIKISGSYSVLPAGDILECLSPKLLTLSQVERFSGWGQKEMGFEGKLTVVAVPQIS